MTFCDLCQIVHVDSVCPELDEDQNVDAENDFIDEMVESLNGNYDG